MKHNIIIIILLVFCCFATQAQDTLKTKKDKQKKEKGPTEITINDKKVEIFRDRLLVDVYHSFWMNAPTEIDNNKFNPGFNVSALWDFKTSKKSPISFGIGLGVSYFSQFSNALLKIKTGDWVMQYNVINSDIKYKLNRLNYINCNLPIEFRYRHISGVKFSVGVRVGLVAEVSQTYKGSDPEGGELDKHYKNMEIYNTQNISVEAYTRIGWKPVSVFYAVQINKLFTADKGPAIFPMSLGISLCIF